MVFIRVRVGSLERAQGLSGSLGFALVHYSATSGRRVHSRSRGFTQAHLTVVGFIRICVGSQGRTLGSSGLFMLEWDHSGAPSGRRVHSGSRGSLRR